MAEINWNIRHRLKDGTELKPGMQFPDNAETRATLARVWAICRTRKGGDKHDKA